MARVLFLHPSKWGRGITAIWIASHAAVLKGRGHEVRLFDCTFYRDWTENENAYNTRNLQYQPTDYDRTIEWNVGDVREDLAQTVAEIQPDIIFWSAISSHIHGEGEYVSIQYGNELLREIDTPALRICGGLQPTAAPHDTLQRFPELTYMIPGESEFVLAEIADSYPDAEPERIKGLVYRNKDGGVAVNPPQQIISDMDTIPPYDYSLFDDQVFLRPYAGQVVRAVDYELSRGCVFTCTYCVETVIQRYYGFTEHSRRGALKKAKAYLRNKSARRVFDELRKLSHDYRITLIRSQDTNFLTIDRNMLEELAGLFEQEPLPIKLYIETRPEGINPATVTLLKRLHVDGVGMGVELSTQAFRENSLNRFADQEKIVTAFKLLRGAGIQRTAYNIIGLPGQREESIIETIVFNQKLDPDNVTVAFYSPFLGTELSREGTIQQYFSDYEVNLDAQLRTTSRHSEVTPELLNFYKENFVSLVRNGLDDLPGLKSAAGYSR